MLLRALGIVATFLVGGSVTCPALAQDTLSSPSFSLRAASATGSSGPVMSPAAPGVFGAVRGTAGEATPPGDLTSFPSLAMLSGGFWPVAAFLGGDCDDPGDFDCDGLPNEIDRCPFFRSTDQSDADRDGRGDVCTCGDQSGDGFINVADILLINLAIFEEVLVSPLCDANNDGACDVGDILAVNARIFGAATTCARHPVP